MNWYGLQVRSRFEDVARTSVEARGIEVFLPTRLSTRRWSDRIKRVRQPLFPGYLFVRLDTSTTNALSKIPGAIGLVSVGKQAAAVDDTEVDSLQRITAANMSIIDHPFVPVGSPVRILRGPLRNVVGTLTQVRAESRFIVSISLLQRSVTVEIDPLWLEAEFVSPNPSAPLMLQSATTPPE